MHKIFFIFILLTSCTNQQNTNVPGANKKASSNPTKTCTCIELWMPVCGENKKTYSNSCFATCANVKFSQGSCEKDTD